MSGQPHHIDGFEIDHLLARGGSASVYEAFDRRHSRKVAVKVLDSRDFEAPKRRAFRRELEAMGRLDDHPYVLSVFDSGFTEDGSPYLVMPLVSTGTVAQRIARDEAFEIDDLLSIAVKLGSALETAHGRGILHCDIKPSNLFIGPFGDPMLGDLGISSISESGVTATNRVSITLRYAAPEVVEGAEHSVRSDIYSFGTTLFAMTDLAPPFDEQSKGALVTQILSASQPPTLSRDVPKEFAQLIYDMMAVDPQQRPESALAVVERLQAIERSRRGEATPAALVRADAATRSRHEMSNAAPASSAHSAATDRAFWRRGRIVAIAALAALLLAAGALALWGLPGSDQTASVSTDRATAAPTAESAAESIAGPTAGSAAEPTTAAPTAESAAEPTTAAPTAEPAAEPAAGPTAESAAEPTTAAPTAEPAAEPATAAPTAEPAAGPTALPTAEPTPIPVDQVAGVTQQSQAVGVPTITGVIALASGMPVESAEVDLFVADDVRPRGDFIEGAVTDVAGRFGFVAPVACYVLTFIAPEGSIIEGGNVHRDVSVCVESEGVSVMVDAVVAEQPATDAAIGGSVRLLGQAAPVAGVHIDAFISEGEQSRGAFVGGTDTNTDGSYSFELAAGCYILTVSAPPDRTVVGGDTFLNSPPICVEAQGTAIFDVEIQ